MTESSIYKIPSPVDGDDPDGPVQVKAAADKIDAIKWLSRSLRPTTGVLTLLEDQTLTTSYVDAEAGAVDLIAKITPSVDSLLKIDAALIFQIAHEDSSFAEVFATIKVNAEADDANPVFARHYGGSGFIGTELHKIPVPGFWMPELKAGGERTVKIRVKKSSGAHVCKLLAGSRFAYTLYAV